MLQSILCFLKQNCFLVTASLNKAVYGTYPFCLGTPRGRILSGGEQRASTYLSCRAALAVQWQRRTTLIFSCGSSQGQYLNFGTFLNILSQVTPLFYIRNVRKALIQRSPQIEEHSHDAAASQLHGPSRSVFMANISLLQSDSTAIKHESCRGFSGAEFFFSIK